MELNWLRAFYVSGKVRAKPYMIVKADKDQLQLSGNLKQLVMPFYAPAEEQVFN